MVGGTLVVGSEDGRLYAVDSVTGNQLWTVDTGAPITSSPAVWNSTVFVGSQDGNVYAIE
jgi:outer membrane protein assembly factor BamB